MLLHKALFPYETQVFFNISFPVATNIGKLFEKNLGKSFGISNFFPVEMKKFHSQFQ